jgi:hypothetical protein
MSSDHFTKLVQLLSILPLTTLVVQPNLQMILFDGVLDVDASNGNISPTYICTSGAYNGATTPFDAANITLTTPINTPLLITDTLINPSITPALGSASVTGMCPQSDPANGSLYSFTNPYTAQNTFSNLNVITGNAENTRYEPPTGFVGTVCFDTYWDVDYGQNTNVITFQIRVGGSTAGCSPTGNQPPVMNPQTISIKKTQSGSFAPFNATDPENDSPYTFTHTAFPSGLNCTESNAGQTGNVITCTPSTSLPVGSYSFDVTPDDSYTTGTAVPFTVQLENPQNVVVEVFKDKPEASVQVGDSVMVQVDIKNPNPFAITTVSTIVDWDESKVEFKQNSLSENTIQGTKYSFLDSLFRIGSVQAEANSGGVVSYPSSNSLQINHASIPANTTYSYVFQVNYRTLGIGNINARSNIQSLDLGNSSDVTILNNTSSRSLIRTGGATNFVALAIGMVLVGSIGLIKTGYSRIKR